MRREYGLGISVVELGLRMHFTRGKHPAGHPITDDRQSHLPLVGTAVKVERPIHGWARVWSTGDDSKKNASRKKEDC